jgi:dCTP deaminase
MILSGQEILARNIFSPSFPRTYHEESGMTFGAGPAGYDVRIRQDVILYPGDFKLASTIERFTMPNNVLGSVHDKSTLARRGISVFNTIVESGWEGFLTLELVNKGNEIVFLKANAPVAQIVCHLVFGEVIPYNGRYQDQPDCPVKAIFKN